MAVREGNPQTDQIGTSKVPALDTATAVASPSVPTAMQPYAVPREQGGVHRSPQSMHVRSNAGWNVVDRTSNTATWTFRPPQRGQFER